MEIGREESRELWSENLEKGRASRCAERCEGIVVRIERDFGFKLPRYKLEETE